LSATALDHTNAPEISNLTVELAQAGEQFARAVVTPVEGSETLVAKQQALPTKVNSTTTITLPDFFSTITVSKIAPNNLATVAWNAITVTKLVAAPTTMSRSVAAPTPMSCSVNPISAAKKSSRRRGNNDSMISAVAHVPIDTSTGHIRALTGENGTSNCLNIRSCTAPMAKIDATEANASPPLIRSPNTASNDTTSQCLKKSELNRVEIETGSMHAIPGTRLRKKAYVEELKQTLNEMVVQRDITDTEQQQYRRRRAIDNYGFASWRNS